MNQIVECVECVYIVVCVCVCMYLPVPTLFKYSS